MVRGIEVNSFTTGRAAFPELGTRCVGLSRPPVWAAPPLHAQPTSPLGFPASATKGAGSLGVLSSLPALPAFLYLPSSLPSSFSLSSLTSVPISFVLPLLGLRPFFLFHPPGSPSALPLLPFFSLAMIQGKRVALS